MSVPAARKLRLANRVFPLCIAVGWTLLGWLAAGGGTIGQVRAAEALGAYAGPAQEFPPWSAICMLLVLLFMTVGWLAFLAKECHTRAKHILGYEKHILGYEWPPGLLEKFRTRYPALTDDDVVRVGGGLRQFFIAHLKSGHQYVAMPSRVVDDLWHELILYTRAYETFCHDAFGGFFHHTPAVALPAERTRDNAGLRVVWLLTCAQEGIDPRRASRLPLLFALDKELNIPEGFRYEPNCAALRRAREAGAHCGADFAVGCGGGCGGGGCGGCGGGCGG